MNRDIRILYSASLTLSAALLVWMVMILFRDFIPSERPTLVKVSVGVVVLAILTLVAGLSHALYTRRNSIDPRFIVGCFTLFGIRILIEFVFA